MWNMSELENPSSQRCGRDELLLLFCVSWTWLIPSVDLLTSRLCYICLAIFACWNTALILRQNDTDTISGLHPIYSNVFPYSPLLYLLSGKIVQKDLVRKIWIHPEKSTLFIGRNVFFVIIVGRASLLHIRYCCDCKHDGWCSECWDAEG